MSKKITWFVAVIMVFGLSSFSYHKFYVSIYQIDLVLEKKRVEITARIFVDDLNLALENEFKTKIHLGEKTQTAQDLIYLQKYLSKHLRITIDGKEKEILFLSSELDHNVMVVYLKINEVRKFKSIKLYNNALLNLYANQQNIMQTNFYNNKKNYIFTGDYFIENIMIN